MCAGPLLWSACECVAQRGCQCQCSGDQTAAMGDTVDSSTVDSMQLPPGTRPLSHQVAGHMHEKNKAGFLETNDGCILKPLQSPPRGTREGEFYKRVFAAGVTDGVTLQLRGLLPVYLGEFSSQAMPNVMYVRMKDVSHKFRNPCISDIKMGRITYDPDASPEKILKEKSKYPPLEKIGFQIRGARVYNVETGRQVFYDKEYLRSLDEETVLTKGLAVFYNKENGLRKDVVRAVLERLYVIRDWFSVQQNWAFYSSSLLVVYEGTPLEKLRQEPANARVAQSLSDMTLIDSRSTSTTAEDKTASSECLPPVESPLADVKMIDFAHVFPAPDGAKDDNYIFGLCKLIRYHEKLLDL